MPVRFDADGDRWEVGYEVHEGRPELDAVVFHCMSNPQRPYRVAPLPADLRRRTADDEPPKERWRQLFERAQVMDFVRDAEADPRNIGMQTEP